MAGSERRGERNPFEPEGLAGRTELGLPAAQKSVAAYKAREAEAIPPQEGSSSSRTERRKSVASASPAEAVAEASPSHKARILIVDDDPAIVRLLAGKLTAEGYMCQTVSEVPQALEALSQQAFDAIISDLHMPGLSGLDLLREVAAKYPQVTFLMATGDGDIQVGIQAMKEGAVDYVLKPFRLDAVLASLERGLERSRLERELENHRQNLEQMVEQRTRQLSAAIRRIELTYDETLAALGAALDLRDNDTAGHSSRVTCYSLEMARAMECTKGELKQIERGAYLHDIGKIGIPDAVLLKPGKLTPEEFEVMQLHVRIGYDLVSKISFLSMAAQIVLTHQERFDGTGYPQGLRGDEIPPLGARIFAPWRTRLMQ